MTTENKEYRFEWKDLGNIAEGRPNLGPNTKVAVYRLMQYTMRSILVDYYGLEKAKQIFIDAGKLAGIEFCKNTLDTSLNINEFIAQLHDKLLEYEIGILQIEKANLDKMKFVVTVSEDLDCSGLPIYGNTVCDYDEGFLEGIFLVYTGKSFKVKEIDCWSTGERTCRFTIELNK